MIAVTIKGKCYFVDVDDQKASIQKEELEQGSDWGDLPDFDQVEQTATDVHTITAVMPCTICKILVQAGNRVRSDDVLFISEAMKMELEIRAGVEGVVTEILTTKGTPVEKGQKLAQIRMESQCERCNNSEM